MKALRLELRGAKQSLADRDHTTAITGRAEEANINAFRQEQHLNAALRAELAELKEQCADAVERGGRAADQLEASRLRLRGSEEELLKYKQQSLAYRQKKRAMGGDIDHEQDALSTQLEYTQTQLDKARAEAESAAQGKAEAETEITRLQQENGEMRARLRGKMGEAAEREKELRFEAALEAGKSPGPSSAAPAHSRGLEAIRAREFQSAAAYLREALRIDPSHIASHSQLAVVLCDHLKRPREAEHHFNEASSRMAPHVPRLSPCNQHSVS